MAALPGQTGRLLSGLWECENGTGGRRLRATIGDDCRRPTLGPAVAAQCEEDEWWAACVTNRESC